MDLHEAETAYHAARQQLDARQITLEEYNRKLASLMIRDGTGVWRAISPKDGRWLRWDGKSWVPTHTCASAGDSQAPAMNSFPVSDTNPETLQTAVLSENPALNFPPGNGVLMPDGLQPAPAAGNKEISGFKTQFRKWTGIAGLAIGIISWFIYPYLLGISALVLGGYSLFSGWIRTGKVETIALAAIVVAISAMAGDLMYIRLTSA